MAKIPVWVCSHIFENTRPFLLVFKENNEWQFLADRGLLKVQRLLSMN